MTPTVPAPPISEVIARLRDRMPVHGHDGRSGATLERATLDGVPVIVKTVDPDLDLTLRVAQGSAGREHDLWRRGVLDGLGPGVTHAIVAAGCDRGRLVTVMRDLGDSVLSWNRRLSPTDLDRVFGALRTVHRRFAGAPPPGLVDLTTRLTLLSPQSMAPLAGTHALAAAVVEGWQHFFELVGDPVATEIASLLNHPAPLAAALGRATPTMCHGDAWLVNMALSGDDVVLLDWNLATNGPALVDFVVFAIGCASHVDLPREQVLAAGRDACRDTVEDDVWEAGVLWALCELGWNKALDAATHHDPAMRSAALDELDWWVARAETALESIG